MQIRRKHVRQVALGQSFAIALGRDVSESALQKKRQKKEHQLSMTSNKQENMFSPQMTKPLRALSQSPLKTIHEAMNNPRSKGPSPIRSVPKPTVLENVPDVISDSSFDKLPRFRQNRSVDNARPPLQETFHLSQNLQREQIH
jgi:hypothetical protein